MLRWALLFFVVAVVAGALGFTDIAVGAAALARIFFGIFLVILLVILVAAFVTGNAVF